MSNNLSETLKEILESKGITLEKLSETTGVPKRYLEALISGEYKHLPAAPYTRGYILKIAKAFRLNGEELWETYRNELSLKISGQNDKLSSNRFALPKKANKKNIIFIIISILVIVYLSFQWRNIFGTPKLEIITPASSEIFVNSNPFKVTGLTDQKNKLIINGEEIVINSTGWFEKDINLQKGPNIIEFEVKKFLGKEIKISKQVIYQP